MGGTISENRIAVGPNATRQRSISVDPMTSLKAALFLALVASAASVIIRGPSVTYDTYIRAGSTTTAPISTVNYTTTNFNNENFGWWAGPLTINATSQVTSGVTSATMAILIKFDLSSIVGATLVPTNPVWLNCFVSDAGNPASLRELTVPWNHVCPPPAKTRAPLTTTRGTLAETPSR